ncbi:MAG TPA: hypothetical protein VJ826_12890 [Candidatus Polarisedimenticolaceae bacterium]|nr:hypothetical protein [Candidatus Polarisedimenticolaceae bacterium]
MRGAILLALLLSAAPLAAQDGSRRAVLEVAPTKAKLGDALTATITLTLSPGDTVGTAAVPPTWGKAEVLDGAWAPPAPASPNTRVWTGRIGVYEIGSIEVPAVPVEVTTAGGPVTVETGPVTLTIEGVLPPAAAPPDQKKPQAPPEISDLKPPASIPPDYGPLKRALYALAGLLAVAGVAWWISRRYAGRFAAAAVPQDPFRKLPPHVWVYEELQRLLARRLAEEGKVGLFYDELTRIVKMYLQGRYRIELLDRTTSEVPGALLQAGAPADAARLARGLLEAGDLVKFAKSAAGPAECRASVEEAYRLVDMTKPQAPAESAAVEGAA